jgi:hypothetical protein
MRNFIPQPSVFMRAETIEKVGMLDENLDFAMDEDYWYRISLYYPMYCLNEVIAAFRLHGTSKSMTQRERFADEHLMVYDKLFQNPQLDQSLLSRKSEFYGLAHIRRGEICRKKGDLARMRRAWLKAAVIFPSVLLRRNLVYRFFLSLIPEFMRSMADRLFMRAWRILKSDV